MVTSASREFSAFSPSRPSVPPLWYVEMTVSTPFDTEIPFRCSPTPKAESSGASIAFRTAIRVGSSDLQIPLAMNIRKGRHVSSFLSARMKLTKCSSFRLLSSTNSVSSLLNHLLPFPENSSLATLGNSSRGNNFETRLCRCWKSENLCDWLEVCPLESLRSISYKVKDLPDEVCVCVPGILQVTTRRGGSSDCGPPFLVLMRLLSKRPILASRAASTSSIKCGFQLCML
mmetsp:Transcript_45581/g.71420  ORF Transcript_45581/g.71420 Transcript_45581/m.71420 type:complete len:230 (-) Transcript_45581:2021-2710(-)